jgi:hypothetical protein
MKEIYNIEMPEYEANKIVSGLLLFEGYTEAVRITRVKEKEYVVDDVIDGHLIMTHMTEDEYYKRIKRYYSMHDIQVLDIKENLKTKNPSYKVKYISYKDNHRK